MRAPLILLAVLLPFSAAAQTQQQGVLVGPWFVEVSFTGDGTFDRCIMSRSTDDGMLVKFGRDEAGLTLVLSSPDWVLEPGATYPVEFAADQWLWQAEVTAAETSVTVALNDATFNQGLRLASDLEVRGAGATLHVPLNGSAAALDRLESCYERNSLTVITNPFVAPARQP
jgi:hypothetical protein